MVYLAPIRRLLNRLAACFSNAFYGNVLFGQAPIFNDFSGPYR
jgi:hypothetical protein